MQVPTISLFFGIAIRMYIRDHPPLHIHAVYADQEAHGAIDTGGGGGVDGGQPEPHLCRPESQRQMNDPFGSGSGSPAYPSLNGSGQARSAGPPAEREGKEQ